MPRRLRRSRSASRLSVCLSVCRDTPSDTCIWHDYRFIKASSTSPGLRCWTTSSPRSSASSRRSSNGRIISRFGPGGKLFRTSMSIYGNNCLITSILLPGLLFSTSGTWLARWPSITRYYVDRNAYMARRRCTMSSVLTRFLPLPLLCSALLCSGPQSPPYFHLLDELPECSLLLKNYPELRGYRDIAMWWKYFLNPVRRLIRIPQIQTLCGCLRRFC